MFSPPFLQFNGHLQTILPSFFRKIMIQPLRERLNLPDGDFLLLDWVKADNDKLVIVTHGLEGDSKRHYVQGIIQKFLPFGFDGLGWNCRSCGGEINSLPRFYHHGDASDLKYLIDSIIESKKYKQIFLVGFSMGGSLTLRVLAENHLAYKNHVMAAAVASVPLDLVTSVAELEKKGKRFYMNRFIKKLKKKIEIKERMFPDHPILKVKNFERIKDFRDFDNIFTAPLHGYLNADDFYKKASVKPILNQIKVPALIMQATNDPFLTPECLDLGEAQNNGELKLFLTPMGGHVGFMQKKSKFTFFEEKALAFCLENIEKNN
jgi:predicted alpha/beta-fold hydrolase